MIRCEIDLKWTLLICVPLYKSIYYQNICSKDITNTIKLIKELLPHLFRQNINKCPYQNYIQIKEREKQRIGFLMIKSHKTKSK